MQAPPRQTPVSIKSPGMRSSSTREIKRRKLQKPLEADHGVGMTGPIRTDQALRRIIISRQLGRLARRIADVVENRPGERQYETRSK